MNHSGISGPPRAGVTLFLVGSLAALCNWPVHVARAQDPTTPAFEVASIKPSGPADPVRIRRADFRPYYFPFVVRGRRLEASDRTIAQLVAAAYQIPAREIVGPSWMSDARFDVDGLVPEGQMPAKIIGNEAFYKAAAEMLRTLLAERFALKAHHENRRVSGYILSIAKDGPKLTEAGPLIPTNNPTNFKDRFKPGFSGQQMGYCDMACLTNLLARDLGAPVDDQTGLKGHYAIAIQYPSREFADETARPSLLREALKDYGLHLAGGKIDAPFLVVDNVSRTPTEN